VKQLVFRNAVTSPRRNQKALNQLLHAPDA